MKYRKKPVEIEAVLWTGTNATQMIDFISDEFSFDDPGGEAKLYIPTLEGEMAAQPGDWIIKGIQGEFYPCKPDIFEATYDKVETS